MSNTPDFLIERVIEGSTPEPVWKRHIQRYRFAQNFVSGKKVLDIACGTGYGANVLAENAKFVLGIDRSEEAIKYAQRRYINKKLFFMVGDAEATCIKHEVKFDIIISFETLEHLPNYNIFLDNVSLLLSPNGIFVVSTPNRTITNPFLSINDAPVNRYHVVEFTLPEFISLLSEYKNLELYGQGVRKRIFTKKYFRFLYQNIYQNIYKKKDFGLVCRLKPWEEPETIIAVCRSRT